MTIPILAALFRAADAPAHEAVRLSRAPFHHTAAPVAIGLLALSASTLAVASLRGAPALAIDGMSALLESIITVAPITLVLAAWGPIASPRVVAAAMALGVLTAGWVALGLVPLAAFVALVSAKTGWALAAFAVLVSIAALGSIATVFARVILALDRNAATRTAARLFAVAIFGVFAARAQPWLTALKVGGLPW